MQPIGTVNDPVFRRLLHELEPQYVPPDRKTIAPNYMPIQRVRSLETC